MYIIVPYVSIGNIKLNSSISLIEDTLGKGILEEVPFFKDTVFGSYDNGIHIEFKLEKASYIGVLISLNPALDNYSFIKHSFEEVITFFKSFPGKIFTDNSVLISEYLGITTYFEDDQLKEVGIFSKEYKEQLIGNLVPI